MNNLTRTKLEPFNHSTEISRVRFRAARGDLEFSLMLFIDFPPFLRGEVNL